MAGVQGTHDNEASEGNNPTSHGDFLLHLLRKGNNNSNNNNNNRNEALPSSFSAKGDPWQLTDPAVAELGPSHNFQNPNPNLPHIWPQPMNSVPDQPPFPLLFDQLPRPLPNPHFSPYPFQNHYDTKPLQPSPFEPLGGGSHGSAPDPFYGPSANGRLGPPPPRWVGPPTYPYGHMPQPPPFPNGVDIHKTPFDAWQLQNHRVGNGMDHLRGFSELVKEGFPHGELGANAIAAKTTENCIGGNPVIAGSAQSNYSARNLSENQNFISRNDVGTSHSVPSAQEQLIRDRILQFGSIPWHSEHEKGIDKGSPLNEIKTPELPNRDILLPNAELPHTLQGQNRAVRFLRRSSSNQQGRGQPADEEKGTLVDGVKAQAAVDRRVPRGSSQKGISKGKTAMGRERRDTTGVAANHSVYRGETRKGSEVQSSLEMERDRNKSNVRAYGKIQSDISRNDGIRNEATQFGVTKIRQTTQPSKELTQSRTDKEGLDNHSFQAGDGDVVKKFRGSQQEWRVKQLQADDHMQSDNFDSFSTIVGHLSALNVNELDNRNSNDELYNPLSSRPPNGDEASSSQPLAFHLDKFGSASVQVFQNEQPHNEFVEGAIAEGSRRSTVEKRSGGNHRVDVIGRRYEEAGIKDIGLVSRENPDDLKLTRNRYKDGNRNNLALPRESKDPESNDRQAMPLPKQGRRQFLSKMRQKEFVYRIDIEMFTPQFLTLYESLIPCKEEETKRKQLISCLEKLVNKQWPEARLHLFGSCANAFGVSKSDIDVCLCIDDESSTKAELVLKLAEILEAEDMQNVQPLTHARVPIVKFTDPLTGISCDICINNILAIENTKLLHDYAQIDVRLQQLAFMVKHWAKCRQINETYQGTLSSYAYVLMCIHFLQQRRPAILPCLQEMEATYRVTIGEIECAYFDKVDELKEYGAKNKETLGQLLSAFFDHWAFRHDYSNSVVSVRTGGFLSKKQKQWTRRIGKERHLICIEDPFEISHDLGRVVDKHSIHDLKDEFQRAAEITQYDHDPCVTLFEPYLHS